MRTLPALFTTGAKDTESATKLREHSFFFSFFFFFFLRKRSLGTAVRLWQDADARTHARTRTEEERGRGGRDAARGAAVRAPAAWGPRERERGERESSLIPNFPRLV